MWEVDDGSDNYITNIKPFMIVHDKKYLFLLHIVLDGERERESYV